MERKIWYSENEEENKKNSLYFASEIIKEHARSNSSDGTSLPNLLNLLYNELEQLRKQTK